MNLQSILRTVVIILCGFIVQIAFSQQETEDSLQRMYKFLKLDENNIQDFGSGMDSVFSSIQTMLNTQSGKVSILHIGDSHLHEVALGRNNRRAFHQAFGNAGRGLMLPYSTNVQFRTEETFRWKMVGKKGKRKKQQVKVIKRVPIGPAQLITNRNEVYLTPDTGLCSLDEYTTATLLRKQGGCTPIIASTVTSQELFLLDGFEPKITLASPSYDLRLQCPCPDSGLNLNGIIFENDSSGLLYNSISIDGASMQYYLESEHIATLVKEIHPSLIIVSLGTNDVYGKTVNKEILRTTILALCDSISNFSPGTPLLLTSPPDCFRKRREVTGIADCSAIMSEVCRDRGYAFWDFYRVMGGKKSMASWVKHGLGRADKVHFTGPGYALESSLFVSAFIKSFQRYAEFRY